MSELFDGIARVAKQYFVTGLFALLPVGITLYIGYQIVHFFDSFVPIPIPGLGLVLAIIVITLFGVLVSHYLGRRVVATLEWLFRRMPVVRSIYDTSKQIITTFFDQKNGAFKRVVLVPYPGNPGKALGFVVNEGVVGDNLIGVFVPFSPPTAGYVLFFPPDAVEETRFAVDEAMRLILSGGLITPQSHAGQVPAV